MLIRAQKIYPVDQSPIDNGFILVRNGVIAELGPRAREPACDDELIDLAQKIIVPGFVNAHCHLELTALGPVVPGNSPIGRIPFTPWIKEILYRKNRLKKNELIDGIKQGIRLLRASGVTTIGDHISPDTPLQPLLDSHLSGRLFCEVLGVNHELCADAYAQAKLIKINSQFLTVHPSPHSVHAVHPNILTELIRNENAPLSLHLAESLDEAEYFAKNSGALAKIIQGRGLLNKHDGTTGLEHLLNHQVDLEKILFIHGNLFSTHDLDLIAQHKLSIVHCPGSHAFFGHPNFPLQSALDLGINIAIGTDSLASNTQLNFVHELKLLQSKHAQLSFESILKMATLNGATALRLADKVGSLTVGKMANIIAINQTNFSDNFKACIVPI